MTRLEQLSPQQHAIALARDYIEKIVANIPIGFAVLDKTQRIQQINHAVLHMFEVGENATCQGCLLPELLGVEGLYEHINLMLKDGKPCSIFGFDRFDSRGMKSYQADISSTQIAGEQVILLMVQDITACKQSEKEIHRLAFYDSLTGLPNRALFQERLTQSMSLGARSVKHGALIFIDLDDFKTINDMLGHDLGDQLLKEVANRLINTVREGDTVARLGGDEFVVTVDSLSSLQNVAAIQAKHIAEKIQAELRKPYLLDGIENNSYPSIGVSLFRWHRNNPDEILKQADLAMYRAKATGRNKVCFFDPAMQSELESRSDLERDLRISIQQNALIPYYQMQVDDSAYIIGAEVLLRWPHPTRGMVSPTQFIPLAEECGMIVQIGDWVLEKACKQLKIWEMNPEMSHIQLSVNVSPKQIGQPYFVEQVRNVIKKTGVRPSHLKFELTEGFILNDVEDAIEKMLELKDIGIRFSMDDFGTGYSSLSYLSRLPLNQLKIDQSFVKNIITDKNSRAMVQTIIQIAKNFGLHIIAEGVETDAQIALLRQYGCNAFQGYLFSKPIPIKEFEDLCYRYQFKRTA